MKLTPPFHTEDGSVVDAFGEYVGTLDPNTAHQALFLLNRPEAEYERQADEVIKLRDEMHVSSINFAAACKEVADKTDDIAALKAECERLRECNDAMRPMMRKLREAVNMPAEGEGYVVDSVLAALAAAKADRDKAKLDREIWERVVYREMLNAIHESGEIQRNPPPALPDQVAEKRQAAWDVRVAKADLTQERIAAALEKIAERMPSKRERLVTVVTAAMRQVAEDALESP